MGMILRINLLIPPSVHMLLVLIQIASVSTHNINVYKAVPGKLLHVSFYFVTFMQNIPHILLDMLYIEENVNYGMMELQLTHACTKFINNYFIDNFVVSKNGDIICCI